MSYLDKRQMSFWLPTKKPKLAILRVTLYMKGGE